MNRWRKDYDLLVQDKHFRRRFNVSVKQEKGTFYSRCIWSDGERGLHPIGHQGSISLLQETREGTTEQEALDELMKWVQSKFGENFTLVEK